MIVLDTNVVSALMDGQPSSVTEWLDRQDAASIWTTAVSVYETRFGIALLPEGRRRALLEARYALLVERALRGRVLPLDEKAAAEAARLAVDRRARGVGVEVRDTLIAGIVLAHRATLATRNLRHFPEVPVVDPWAQ
jgi:predicted nucleic acid-binding protein